MTQWPEGWTRDGAGKRRRAAGGRPYGAAPGDRDGRGAPPRDGADRHPGTPERTRVLPVTPGTADPTVRTPAPAPAPAHPLPPTYGRRRRRWLPRLALLVPLLVVALVVGLVLVAYARIDTVDALGDYAGRPAETPGRDVLVVGSDSREGLSDEQRRELGTGSTEGRRTDTIMLLHVPRDGDPVLVGLPRDSYVEIPGRGADKLNASFALGGPQLLARTVEQATGIRLDDYVEIGFGGFVGVVDALGGVRLCPETAIEDARAHLDVPAGCQQMDGPTALGYVRARYSDPRGDLGRIERQQEFIGSVADAAASPGVLLNPLRWGRLAISGGDALTVDERTGVVDLARIAWAMRGVAGGGVRTTVPVAGTADRAGAGNVVLWDDEGAAALFEALRRDAPVPAGLLAG